MLAVLALLVLPFLIVAGWFAWQLYEPGGEGDPVSVTVQQGWGGKEIGDELAAGRRGIVARLPGVVPRLRRLAQAGTYALHEHMGVKAATDALGRGPQMRPRAASTRCSRCLPGSDSSRSPTASARLPGHDRAAFLALAQSGQVRSKYQGDQTSVEGFTWPDTYFVEG